MKSQLRYDSSNRFISRRLISGASFMFISSIVFKKWREAVDGPSPSPGTAIKAHSLISGNFLAALGWDKLVPGLPPSGSKHRGELTSRNGKSHMNSLHRDERPKT